MCARAILLRGKKRVDQTTLGRFQTKEYLQKKASKIETSNTTRDTNKDKYG